MDIDARRRPCDALRMSFEAAQRIRSLLAERGLSERQASIASGLSPATVNALLKRLEAGSGRLEQRTVDALAATLGVSPAWMLHGIGDADAAPPPPQEETAGAPTRFDALPNWTGLSRAARAQKPNLPEWVWQRVARAAPMLTATPSPAMVADLAEFVFRHEAPPV